MRTILWRDVSMAGSVPATALRICGIAIVSGNPMHLTGSYALLRVTVLDALEEDMPAGAEHVVDGGYLLEAEVPV